MNYLPEICKFSAIPTKICCQWSAIINRILIYLNNATLSRSRINQRFSTLRINELLLFNTIQKPKQNIENKTLISITNLAVYLSPATNPSKATVSEVYGSIYKYCQHKLSQILTMNYASYKIKGSVPCVSVMERPLSLTVTKYWSCAWRSHISSDTSYLASSSRVEERHHLCTCRRAR